MDGVLEAAKSSILHITAANPLNIGRGAYAKGYFNGNIDEVVLFKRVLNGYEIKDQFNRAASSIQFQVRSCDDSMCDTESFIGPDGTSASHYSELMNTSALVPDIALVNVADNQYFQYKAFLKTDKISFLPELKSVTVGPPRWYAE